MKQTETPRAFKVRIVSNSTETSRSSSEEVGSSMMTRRAFWMTARAIATMPGPVLTGIGHEVDRSVVTISELPLYIAHLAFYAGWPKVMSALPVVRDVFESRTA